jgi:aminopeptidase N
VGNEYLWNIHVYEYNNYAGSTKDGNLNYHTNNSVVLEWIIRNADENSKPVKKFVHKSKLEQSARRQLQEIYQLTPH